MKEGDINESWFGDSTSRESLFVVFNKRFESIANSKYSVTNFEVFVKVSSQKRVIAFNTLSCMYSKIAILTGIGMTELRFLGLIPPGKILLLTVVQADYQGIPGFF